MKIAIVEWYPRICGATDWGHHLAGARIKGWDIERVTFSRSGKPLKDWNRASDFTVHKIRDAVAVLNKYDLIIPTDVVCFAPKLAWDEDGPPPYYVEVMQKLKKPWTTMYHGAPYAKRHDRVIHEILKTKSFTGRLITLRLPDAERKVAPLGPKRLEFFAHPFLPYDLARADDVPKTPASKRRAAVMMTARIAVNKGMNAVTALMPELHGPVELWGYNSFGLPSIGWRLWELAVGLGYKGKVPALRDDVKHLTHPRAHRFYTGSFTMKSKGNSVRYFRQYRSLAEVDWTPWLHLSLANIEFRGILEYATLDAMAVGSVAVVPEHAIAFAKRAWDSLVTVPYERCNFWTNQKGEVRGGIEGDTDKIISTLNHWLDAPHSKCQARAKLQRAVLENKHDPSTILKLMVKELT